MLRLWLVSLLALVAIACPSPSGNDGGRPDGGSDGGGGGTGAAWAYYTIDPQSSDLKALAMAQQGDRVGVAYFVSIDGGIDEAYEIRYAEWRGSTGQVSAPERISTVRRSFGISVAFQQSGEPAVAYLGGGSDNSVYWLNSDAIVATRSGGTWTEQTVARRGDEANCGNPVSDRGVLVGLSPALLFDGANRYLVWRDGHDGQFANQDWDATDIELAEGPGWTKRCLVPGGNDKRAWGGHMQLVLADGQPALVFDQLNGWEGPGHDVFFMRRNPDGSWTSPRLVISGNTQLGPSMAYDSVLGFGVAVVDPNSSLLQYRESKDGTTWSTADPVVQYGSGGWYASLAFDPVNHEPAVAFYLCSDKSGVTSIGDCPPGEDGLFVRQRIADNWRETPVDAEGGYLPKLGFLSSGKRFVVYRLPANGSVRLAVER